MRSSRGLLTIPASSDTVESEGPTDEAVLKKALKEIIEKIPSLLYYELSFYLFTRIPNAPRLCLPEFLCNGSSMNWSLKLWLYPLLNQLKFFMDVLLRNLAFFNLKAMGYLQKQCKLSQLPDCHSSHLEKPEHIVVKKFAQLELLAGGEEGAGHLGPGVEGGVRLMVAPPRPPVIHAVHSNLCLCKNHEDHVILAIYGQETKERQEISGPIQSEESEGENKRGGGVGGWGVGGGE